MELRIKSKKMKILSLFHFILLNVSSDFKTSAEFALLDL